MAESQSDADVVASALDLPFSDEGVDEIYSAHLVEHFTPEEAQKFFDEVYRVLKKSGRAEIKIDREWSRKRLLKKDKTHKHRYNDDEIKKMVGKFSKADAKSKPYFLGFRYHVKNLSLPHNKIFVHLIK